LVDAAGKERTQWRSNESTTHRKRRSPCRPCARS